MVGLYSPIFLLQMFCLYHAYQNSREYYWYFIILFIPLIGAGIYFYYHFVNQRNIDLVTETLEQTFTTDATLNKLKKELAFSDTIKNRLNLANEYLRRGAAREAIAHYEVCLKGTYQNDPAILTKLLHAYYLEKEYEKVVQMGDRITDDPNFKKAVERVSYALSLHAVGQTERATEEFRSMDVTYANYPQRMAFARFLHKTGHPAESMKKLDTMKSEINLMDKAGKRLNSDTMRKIKQVHQSGWK